MPVSIGVIEQSEHDFVRLYGLSHLGAPQFRTAESLSEPSPSCSWKIGAPHFVPASAPHVQLMFYEILGKESQKIRPFSPEGSNESDIAAIPFKLLGRRLSGEMDLGIVSVWQIHRTPARGLELIDVIGFRR